MQGRDRDIYRIPNEELIPPEEMNEEERDLRALLADFTRNPDDPHTLINVVHLLMGRQLYEEAKPYLERYLKARPDDPQALNCAGVIHFVQGDFVEAESFFEQALNLDDELRDALYNCAMICSERGDFEKAQHHFGRLAELEPSNPEVFNNLGAVLYQDGDPKKAEANFRKALDVDPQNTTALQNIIELLVHEGRRDEAEQYFKSFEQSKPGSAELEELRGLLFQGSPLEPDRDYVEFTQEALALAPTVSTSLEGEAGGLRIGIVSDWGPGDRGELAWWIWQSLKQNGHSPSVLARIGKLPHCKDQKRLSPPRAMGRWVVPDLTLSGETTMQPEHFNSWLKSMRPDAVVFVDEEDQELVRMAKAEGIAVLAVPAFIGATRDTPSRFSSFDAVIAVTPWIQEALQDGMTDGKWIPSDLGVDLDLFKPSIRERKETVFLFDAGHGSVEELENLLSVLTAFGMLGRDAAERSQLLIRTAADLSLFPEEIRNRAEGNPRIDVINGNLDDRWFLMMGDVLVHLRLSPGIHWLVPEASASGVPSVILDKSPAAGWILDKQMILKIPRSADFEGREVSTSPDVKCLADTMSMLATDTEVLAYMSDLCREKANQLLDGRERSRVLCDKIVTAVAEVRGRAEAPQDESTPKEMEEEEAAMSFSMDEGAIGSENLIEAIDKALAEGRNSEARELLALYKRRS